MKMLVSSLMILVMALPVAADWGVRGMANDKQIEAMVMYGESGYQWFIWGQWHEDNPKRVNGVGFGGLYDVSPNMQIPLKNFFPWIGEALNLPETISATNRIGLMGGPVNTGGKPDAWVAPLVELQTGPLLVQYRYDIVEAGGRGANPSGPVLMLGIEKRF